MSRSKLMNSKAGSRFELLIDGCVATYIDYVDRGYALEPIHTVTRPDFRGRELAGRLVNFALTRVEAEEKRIISTCSFVAEYVTKKPEFTHLAARFPHPWSRPTAPRTSPNAASRSPGEPSAGLARPQDEPLTCHAQLVAE